MEIEEEVKILEIDKESVIKKLEELNAEKYFDEEIITIYYDYPDSSLGKKGAIVRLRKEGKEFLDFKQSVESTKIKKSKEIRVGIDSLENAEEFLKEIGMKKILEIKKHRTGYKILNTKVEIEEIESFDIPCFLEIEGESIDKIIELLDLKDKERVCFDTFELLEHYGKLSSKNSFSKG